MFPPSFHHLELPHNIYKDICHLASILFDVPPTTVALLEAPRKQLCSSEYSPGLTSLFEHLFNNHLSRAPREILVIENIHEDERTKDICAKLYGNLPTFIAIAPLIDATGLHQGLLCISDTESRGLGPEKSKGLKILADLIASSITVEKDQQQSDGIKFNTELGDFSVDGTLEKTNTSSWKWETGTGHFYINPTFLQILGYTSAELEVKSLNQWTELIFPADSLKFSIELELWNKKNSVHKELEFRMFHKNGQIIWLHFTAKKVTKNELDLPILIEGEIHDITSQKKVWEQIDFISPKYTSVIQAGYNWFSVIDAKGDFTYVSTSSGLAMGYSSEDLYGKNYFNFVHSEERENAYYNFMKFLDREPFISKPFRFKHNDGSWKWIEVLLLNLCDDPEIQGIVVNARDITDKMSLSNNLRSSQENQRFLFNSSPFPKYLLDLDTYKIMEVNDTMIDHFGYSREELIGMEAINLKPKADVPVFIDAVKNAKPTEETNRYGVFSHQTKNGEISQLELVGYPLTVKDRDCMLISCNDVSERELYLYGLKQSERQLKKAASIAKLGYWSLELNSFSISWSDEVYTIWGRNKETFALDQNNFLATVHPDDRGMFEKENEHTFCENRMYDLTYRIILPDGSIRWVNEISHFVVGRNGVPDILEGTVQDVTDRKKEEQHLRLLESVVTNTKEAVMIIEAEPFDRSGRRIIYVNQAFVAMTGYTAREVIGKTASIFNSPNTDPIELNRIEEVLDRRKAFDVTIINKNKIGEDYWVNLVANPVTDQHGKHTHWVSIGRDVTKVKNSRLQKELLNEIGFLFNGDETLESCLANVLEHLIKKINYDRGQIWLPGPDKTTLTLAADHVENEMSMHLLKNKEPFKTCQFGEGLPGTVWKGQEIAVWDSVEIRETVDRNSTSDTSCSQATTGFPLIHNDEIIGILVLGVDNSNKSPLFYGELIKQLQTYLGETVKRKRLEIELDQIFKFTPDIICKIGEDGFFKKTNPAATKLLGYSEEEFLSKNLLEFVHPLDRTETLEQLRNLYLGQPLQYFENRYLTKDGKTKWLSWTADLTQEKGITYAVAKDITEKKEIKELLKEITDMSRIGAWEINFEDGTMYWSEMTKKIHEVDDNYIPDLQSILGFYKGQKNTKKFSELIHNTFHEDEAFDLEMPIITAKGKEKWVRVIGKPEFINDRCYRIYGSFQDIHELKTSQLDHIRTNNEKNAILESIGDAFLSLTKEGVVTYWNQKAEDSFGIDREKVLDKHIEKAYPQLTKHKIFITIIKSIKSNRQFTFEEYFPNSNKWYEINAYPSGNGYSIYIKDVSERLKAEKEIRLTNERFARVAQSTTDAIWDWDISENTLFLGDAFKSLFGHEISENAENLQLWANQLHPEDKEQVVRSFNKVVHDHKSHLWESEYRFLKATGEYAYVWDKGTVIRDQDGKAIRIIGSMTDITLRKTYEKSLRQLNRELEERALNIEAQNIKLREIAWIQSHIVRAPLARLMGLVCLIKDELVSEEEKTELLGHIYDSAIEFDLIIKDIVDKSQSVVNYGQ